MGAAVTLVAACSGTSAGAGSSTPGGTSSASASAATSSAASPSASAATSAGAPTSSAATSSAAGSAPASAAGGQPAAATTIANATPTGGPYHFELITKSNASPYWLAVKAGADAAAKKLGNVTVTFEAPASGTDLSSQVSMVNNAVTAHVDGIILAAQQPQALVGPVKNAQGAGIPVITVDSGVSPNVSKSFLATSNIGAAAALAKDAVTDIMKTTKGEYGIVDFNQVASTGRERPQGFKQGMAAYPNFKFVGMQISNNIVATAKSETQAMLQANPGITLMFGANDRAALGVAEGVQAAHKVSTVTVVGFDADLGEVPLINQKVIKASVLQSPYSMGYEAVMGMVNLKHGKSIPQLVDTPYYIVTPGNITTPAAKTFLQQYLSANG